MSRSRRSRSARRARGPSAVGEGLALQAEIESPDARAEEAFFERGLIEERATLEALSKRPPAPAAPRPGLPPRIAVAMSMLGLGVLGLGTFAVVRLGAAKAARTPTPNASASPSSSLPLAKVEVAPAPAPPAEPAREVAAPPAPEPVANELPGPACRAAIAAKRRREMLESCAAAVGADPEGATLALSVARIELERGRSASARAWAQRSVSTDPNLAEAYVIIGSVDQDSGRSVAAREAYARYLTLAPKGRYAADLRAILRGR
jgi:hypothetical protein